MEVSNQEELIRQLSIKYNKAIGEVRKAVMHQFKFVSKKTGELAEIRLPFFGTFKPNIKKLKKINETVEKNRNGKSKGSC